MRVFLYVIVAVASTSALIALTVYVALLYRGDSRILYSTWDVRLTSGRTTLFFAAAAIAFFVCLYQGARAMLGWMPGGWGGVDEYGEFRHVSTVFAAMFAMGGGVFLIQAIDRATHDRFALREFAERAKGLERLLEASLDDRWLASTAEQFKKRITELEAELTANEGKSRNMTSHLQPEGQLIQMYRELAGLAERQQQRLAQTLGRPRNMPTT